MFQDDFCRIERTFPSTCGIYPFLRISRLATHFRVWLLLLPTEQGRIVRVRNVAREGAAAVAVIAIPEQWRSLGWRVPYDGSVFMVRHAHLMQWAWRVTLHT